MKGEFSPSRGRRVFVRGARNGVNIMLCSTSLAGAAMLGSWHLSLLAVAMYVGFICLTLLSPSSWRRVLAEERESKRRLPPADQFKDPFLREMVARFQASHQEAHRIVADAPDEFRRRLDEFVPNLSELEAYAAALVRRIVGMSDYLQLARREPVEREIGRIRVLMEQAGRAESLQEYAGTLVSWQTHLAALDDIERARARAFAKLGSVVAVIGAVPVRITRACMLGEEAREGVYHDAAGEMERMERDLLALQEAATTMELNLDGRPATALAASQRV